LSTLLYRAIQYPLPQVIAKYWGYWIPAFAGMTLLFGLAVGRLLGQQRNLASNRKPLALEIIGDSAAQRRIGNVVGAVGLDWQITSGELVCPLGSGFYAREVVRDRELDGLVVADLEMKIGMLLDRAPIAAIERVGADEVKRPRHVATGALGEHEQDLSGHGFAEQAEAAPREIGRAPFARAGVHVEREERIPMGLGEVTPGHPFDLYSIGERVAPLLPNRLPFAR
jgi:hypothetical protein